MNDLVKDVTGIAMAIVGVAILYTLVNPRNNTVNVVGAVSGGFSNALATAMGISAGNSGSLLGQ